MAVSLLRGIRKRGKIPFQWTPPTSPQKPEQPADEARSAIVASLTEMITCPVCTMMIIKGSVANCQNDHLICSSCHENCDRCPLCRGPWQGRNRNVEILRNILLQHEKIPCFNVTMGCSDKVFYHQMGTHLAWCPETSVRCPSHFNGVCNWLGPVRELIPHVMMKGCATFVREVSRRIYETGAVVPYPLRLNQSPSSTLTAPRHFIFQGALPARTVACLTIIPDPNRLTFMFRYLGVVLPHVPYSGSCSLMQPFSNSVAFSFGGALHPSSASMDSIRQSGHFLQLSDKQVTPLLDGVCYLRFQVAFPLDPPEVWQNPPPPLPELESTGSAPEVPERVPSVQSPASPDAPLNLELPLPVQV